MQNKPNEKTDIQLDIRLFIGGLQIPVSFCYLILLGWRPLNRR